MAHNTVLYLKKRSLSLVSLLVASTIPPIGGGGGGGLKNGFALRDVEIFFEMLIILIKKSDFF